MSEKITISIVTSEVLYSLMEITFQFRGCSHHRQDSYKLNMYYIRVEFDLVN